MTFWIFAIGTAIFGLAAMLWPLLRPTSPTVSRSSFDMQIYKDQLKEVEADLARGTLSEAEAKASRTEVSRRLLAAADAQSNETISGNAPASTSRILAVLVSVAVVVIGVLIYQQIGVRGMPDFPFDERASQRPTQLEAEQLALQSDVFPDIQQADPKHLELVAQLKDVLKDRPDDLTGHRMLADNLAQLGNYIEAREAQDVVMRILGDQATAADYSSQAEIMIVAANWYVSPEAETALVKAFDADPTDPRARYYAGILMIQRQDFEQAYAIWSALLTEGPADAPWIPVIEDQIDAVAAEAGITRGNNLAGPTADQINAAGEMSVADRNEMIAGMVAQLSERLATEGGAAEEWAQLIRAYGILGETANASDAWAEAKDAFADSADDLLILLEAARDAEVSAR